MVLYVNILLSLSLLVSSLGLYLGSLDWLYLNSKEKLKINISILELSLVHTEIQVWQWLQRQKKFL